MPLSFKRKPSKRSKKKLKPLDELIPPGRIVTQASLPPSRRLEFLYSNSPITSVLLPGGTALLMRKNVPLIRSNLRQPEEDLETPWLDDLPPFTIETHSAEAPDQRANRNARAYSTRHAVARRWTDHVLPRILPLYLQHKAKQSRKDDLLDPETADQVCKCTTVIRLKLIILHLLSLNELELNVCDCRPAPDQLIRQGLFPNAPSRPSIAADFQLLDIISASFIHLALNVTGWVALLEQIWSSNGFHFLYKGTLRHRLTSCILYYQQLLQLAKIRLGLLLSGSQSRPASPPLTNLYALPVSSAESMDLVHSTGGESMKDVDSDKEDSKESITEAKTGEWDEDPEANEPVDTHHSTTPSPVLESRCPLCFSGAKPNFTHTQVDVIVCVDACFSQKRHKSKYNDPAFITHSSIFLSNYRIISMEQEVSQLRARPPKRRLNALPVDDTVLDECERSFVAAQSSRPKTSTVSFEDTGLMALLCRHDQVLFLANMKSAGEKQHYVLALLKALFDELPADWKVGVLYDIGCQLHRSCEKFGLLPQYSSRITWGLSVFHAYGHQWSCQLAYHPRKRSDFGFSDGEGCERLWSSIRYLVGPLRRANHYRRLFAIDTTIQYLTDQNLWNLGSWISQKLRTLVERTNNAKAGIRECPVAVSILRKQWALQIAFQTTPLPRRSKSAAQKQVGKLLLLQEELASLKEKIRESDQLDEEKSAEIVTRMRKVQTQVQNLEKTLGSGIERMTLDEAKRDPFISARLSAQVLQDQLIGKIQARKFELSRVENHSRRPAMGAKLYAHTKASVQSRDAGIKSLAQAFNRQVTSMENLRSSVPEYQGLSVPKKLDINHIFRLDVFSTLLEDNSLSVSDGAKERWQTDPNVRRGIPFLLELDRCGEEKERLDWECKQAVKWSEQHARKLCTVFQSLDPTDIEDVYALSAYTDHFRRMLIHWNTSLVGAYGKLLFTPAIHSLDGIPPLPDRVVSNTLATDNVRGESDGYSTSSSEHLGEGDSDDSMSGYNKVNAV